MSEDINKETQEKQNYLRENIIDAGYDANAFVEFLVGKKGEAGADVVNWSLPDLKNVVQEFISGQNNNNIQQEENKEDNENKNNIEKNEKKNKKN